MKYYLIFLARMLAYGSLVSGFVIILFSIYKMVSNDIVMSQTSVGYGFILIMTGWCLHSFNKYRFGK